MDARAVDHNAVIFCAPMNLRIQGLRPFLPAQDFDRSREFYTAIGFEEVWTSESLVLFRAGDFSFFVQKYYVKDWADNTMLDLRVEDADAFFRHLEPLGLAERFSKPVRVNAPAVDDNGIRRGAFVDPAGVLWHFSQD